jgi:hypothetical protein
LQASSRSRLVPASSVLVRSTFPDQAPPPNPPSTAASVLFGFMAGTVCNFATQIKFFAGYDDSLDVRFFFVPPNLVAIRLKSASGVCISRSGGNRRQHFNRTLRTGECGALRWLHRHPRWLARPPLDPARVARRRLGGGAHVFVHHDRTSRLVIFLCMQSLIFYLLVSRASSSG